MQMNSVTMISNGITTVYFNQKWKGNEFISKKVSEIKYLITEKAERTSMCPEEFCEYILAKCKSRLEKVCVMSIFSNGSFDVWNDKVVRFNLPTHNDVIRDLSDMFIIYNHIQNGEHFLLSSEAYEYDEAYDVFYEFK